MSGGPDDSDYKVGRGKPPKASQFKPGTSGNKRGRPTKRQPILVPNEVRRTILRLLDETVEIKTAKGTSQVTMFEALFRRMLTGAANGQPTMLRHALKLIEAALHDRVNAHQPVRLTELLQDMQEDAQKNDPEHRKLVKAQLAYIAHIVLIASVAGF